MKKNLLDNNIDDLLREKKITQTELARRVGIRREYMSRIINRKITPSLSLGILIAGALRLRVEDLFFIDPWQQINNPDMEGN